MKIIESESGWRIDDVIRKFGKILVDHSNNEYTKPEEVFKRELINFINSLPNGDYTKISKQYNNDEILSLGPINLKKKNWW